jgi:hypothetical protein
MRLLGIGMSSFSVGKRLSQHDPLRTSASTGLGDMTYMQLASTYTPSSIGGYSVGLVLHSSLAVPLIDDY